MFLNKVAQLLFCLFLIIPAAEALATDADPSKEYLADYQKAVERYTKQQRQDINDLTKPVQPGVAEELKVFKKKLRIRMKGSSLTRAFRLAKDELNARVKEWSDEIASEGYTPVDEPKPVIEFEPKHGVSGFQYYVRLKLYLKLWAQKTR